MSLNIQHLENEIIDQYLYDEHHSRPWIIGFSGGKDSTMLLQVVWNALKKIEGVESSIFNLKTNSKDALPIHFDYEVHNLQSELYYYNQYKLQQSHSDPKYKKELCSNFINNGTCKYNYKCRFAHGISDLMVGNEGHVREIAIGNTSLCSSSSINKAYLNCENNEISYKRINSNEEQSKSCYNCNEKEEIKSNNKSFARNNCVRCVNKFDISPKEKESIDDLSKRSIYYNETEDLKTEKEEKKESDTKKTDCEQFFNNGFCKEGIRCIYNHNRSFKNMTFKSSNPLELYLKIKSSYKRLSVFSIITSEIRDSISTIDNSFENSFISNAADAYNMLAHNSNYISFDKERKVSIDSVNIKEKKKSKLSMLINNENETGNVNVKVNVGSTKVKESNVTNNNQENKNSQNNNNCKNLKGNSYNNNNKSENVNRLNRKKERNSNYSHNSFYNNHCNNNYNKYEGKYSYNNCENNYVKKTTA